MEAVPPRVSVIFESARNVSHGPSNSVTCSDFFRDVAFCEVRSLAVPYLSTLSSTQILPERSSKVKTKFFWLSENPTNCICCGIIKLGLSNVVTRKGSPTGLPWPELK